MATLIRTIARRCINEYEGINLDQFYILDALDLHGYCSERLLGVLLEEALARKPQTMGRCIAEAEQDGDLERAFRHLDYMLQNNRFDAKFRLRHDFMVVLAHAIKAELYDDLEAIYN